MYQVGTNKGIILRCMAQQISRLIECERSIIDVPKSEYMKNTDTNNVDTNVRRKTLGKDGISIIPKRLDNATHKNENNRAYLVAKTKILEVFHFVKEF